MRPLNFEDLPVRRLVYEGDPESQIAAFAQAEDVQLVVIPTHGYGVAAALFDRSVDSQDPARPLLSRADWSAHGGRRPLANVKLSNIVCALDLGPQSADTLAWASRLAKDFEARLSVVHVIPSISPGLYVTFSSR